MDFLNCLQTIQKGTRSRQKLKMTSWNLLIVLVALIILFAVLVGFWLYSSSLKQRFSQIISPEETPPELEFSVNRGDIDIGDEIGLGELFESCPCKKGLICDNGICK